MAKIKLTKTELKAQTDALKRFQRFLPMLQLKKQQLQGEIAGIVAKADAVSAREREVRERLDGWVALFATGGPELEGLVSVKQIRTSQANIAGVEIPVFDGIDTEVKPIDLCRRPRGRTTPWRRGRAFSRFRASAWCWRSRSGASPRSCAPRPSA